MKGIPPKGSSVVSSYQFNETNDTQQMTRGKRHLWHCTGVQTVIGETDYRGKYSMAPTRKSWLLNQIHAELRREDGSRAQQVSKQFRSRCQQSKYKCELKREGKVEIWMEMPLLWWKRRQQSVQMRLAKTLCRRRVWIPSKTKRGLPKKMDEDLLHPLRKHLPDACFFLSGN